MALFAPIRDYVDTLVHPSAQHDPLAAARHRAFIAPRLLGSVVALASFPIYLIARGSPGAIELIVFAWLLAPILIAYFLSRTGRYESAHILSSLALTVLVTIVAGSTGGVSSFAAIWLVLVPIEPALSASRRVVAAAATFAFAAAGLLVLLGAAHLLPAPASGAPIVLAALGVVSGALCATGLALGVEATAQRSSGMRYAEEDRYRLLARNATDVITRHGRDGSVLFISPAAEMLFGLPLTSLRGHGLFERVHVADRPAYLTALGDAGALVEARSVEFRVRREPADAGAAPEFVWIEMRCRPFEGDGEATDGETRRDVVAVLRNVSERKQQQQAIELARGNAERADARKSRFLTTMSHELRTPLNAIIGFSEMLMKETALRLDGKSRNEYAALINGSGRHLLSVVNGILDMSKIETDNFPINPEPFSPLQVVASCCELVAIPAQEAGIALVRSVSGDLPEIIADKRALNQILLNLLSNAIRFCDRGGKVTIAARAEAGSIAFTIEDDGVGMSEEDLARVGEPYFQAGASYDRRHGGTGLGLSIVKGLVRLHGGDLSIRSRLGMGTRVTVCLPLDCERSRGAGQRTAEDFDAAVAQVKTLAHLAAGPATLPPATPFPLRDGLSQLSDIAVKKSA